MDGGVAFREGLLLPFVGSPFFFESDLLAASQFTLLSFLSFFCFSPPFASSHLLLFVVERCDS